MKGVLTKMKNKEIREETDKIKEDDNFTYDEKKQQIGEIEKQYNIDLFFLISFNTYSSSTNKKYIKIKKFNTQEKAPSQNISTLNTEGNNTMFNSDQRSCSDNFYPS